ncbi:hypothetical protein [Arundinibacter roseus]|uniref:Uncharacterized protein n=1 Tax=Arundinibacter roseus TaxID=2070510 RepID=A0A4R4K2Y2_9BACT|nr:hypothetical protein [Arundinibacter roseus]TDB60389.1 hypothetical protein EZE20_20870 [Arundinibacter roseus]
MEYNEADFVEYAFKEMGISILKREGKYFFLANNFEVEVEGKDLYRLSNAGWVISPFHDIGALCNFIKANAS